jgi:DNA-binding response OmpR family regulator
VVLAADPAFRADLAAALAAEGFGVWQTESARDAFSTFLDHTGEIDVLVIDAGLDDLPGAALLRLLRAHFPGMSCVFVGDPMQAAELRACGAWAVPRAGGRAAVVGAVREAIGRDTILND